MAGEELFISGGPLTDIEIGAEGIREIYQNVRVILATFAGSLMLDRHFGLRQNMVDDPLPVAKQKFTSEVTEKIQKYEPRVRVVRVGVTNPGITETADGAFYPNVVVRIREGVLL